MYIVDCVVSVCMCVCVCPWKRLCIHVLHTMYVCVQMVAKGKDCSDLFPAVVKNVVSKNSEVHVHVHACTLTQHRLVSLTVTSITVSVSLSFSSPLSLLFMLFLHFPLSQYVLQCCYLFSLCVCEHKSHYGWTKWQPYLRLSPSPSPCFSIVLCIYREYHVMQCIHNLTCTYTVHVCIVPTIP